MPRCSACGKNVDEFAQGGGPLNRICHGCVGDDRWKPRGNPYVVSRGRA